MEAALLQDLSSQLLAKIGSPPRQRGSLLRRWAYLFRRALVWLLCWRCSVEDLRARLLLLSLEHRLGRVRRWLQLWVPLSEALADCHLAYLHPSGPGHHWCLELVPLPPLEAEHPCICLRQSPEASGSKAQSPRMLLLVLRSQWEPLWRPPHRMRAALRMEPFCSV